LLQKSIAFPIAVIGYKYKNPIYQKNHSTIMTSSHYQKTIARLALQFFIQFESKDSTGYADTI
jgi:hypothetical protein